MSESDWDVRLKAALKQITEFCNARGWSMGFAESCTGGLVSTLLCENPGVSSFYRGGVVSYAGTVKTALLGVPWRVLKSHGEVSLPTARLMAAGVRKAVGSDWGLSTTGLAGPGGGTPRKPVGTVCFGVAGPGVERTVQHVFPAEGGRRDIQRRAALFAFEFLVNAMI